MGLLHPLAPTYFIILFINSHIVSKTSSKNLQESENLGIDKTKDALQAKKWTTFVFTRQVGAFFRHSDATPP
jgi:hypothetical protein